MSGVSNCTGTRRLVIEQGPAGDAVVVRMEVKGNQRKPYQIEMLPSEAITFANELLEMAEKARHN